MLGLPGPWGPGRHLGVPAGSGAVPGAGAPRKAIGKRLGPALRFFSPFFLPRVVCCFSKLRRNCYQTVPNCYSLFFPFGVQTKFPKRFGFRTFGFQLGPFGFRLGKMFYLCRFNGNLSLLKVFCPGHESANGGTVWSTAPSFYPCAGSLEQSCKILAWC